jgi:hypothetical protein
MPSALTSTMTRTPCEEDTDKDTITKHLPPPEAWKAFPKDKIPFLAVPPEIHLRIFSFLNPLDAVCLSLVKYVTLPLLPSLNKDKCH